MNALIIALSSRPPASIRRNVWMERWPRLLSHQNRPALAVEIIVSTRSPPGRATALRRPRPLPTRMMKKMTFQNSATRAWKKARPSSL